MGRATPRTFHKGPASGSPIPNCLRAGLLVTGWSWIACALLLPAQAEQVAVPAGGEGPPAYNLMTSRPDSSLATDRETAGAPSAGEVPDFAQPAAPPPEPGPEGGEPPGVGLLKDSIFEKWGQGIEHWKSQWPVSVTGGAYNWWHVNNGGPLASGYGIPACRAPTPITYLSIRSNPLTGARSPRSALTSRCGFATAGCRCGRSTSTTIFGSGRLMAFSTRRWDA